MPSEYPAEREKCAKFLQDFLVRDTDEEGDDVHIAKYTDLLNRVAANKESVINIELDDLYEHAKDEAFVKRVESNTPTYIRAFSQAIDRLLPPPTSYADGDSNEDADAYEVLRMQRTREAERLRQTGQPTSKLPEELLRRYALHILPRSNIKVLPLREVKSAHIGHLVRVRAIVTRVHDVKPHLVIAAYTCECGAEMFQEVTGNTFMPILKCPSGGCKKAGRPTLQNRGSKFIDYQEIRIQELTEHVPIGHIPRTMKVILRGTNTRSCAPGDIVTVDGVFMPTPFSGFSGLRAGLLADTYIEAMHVEQHKKSYNEYVPTKDLLEKIQKAAHTRDVYTRLARSIAPEIYGHVDVKKALLLLMVGGVTRVMDDGMKIRGDINICLMGDPGVAKSQLLKHIATVAPRGIYTSGKGSSGVGLTAAVLKDPVTGEFVLEGGSLVLADMGICCIDEFDKMEESDRTSIHEVMEQQTISIAKAGITTTLNARTAILAAANPAYGRYNPHRTAEENFNLPAALMSRFDLLFLLVDRPDLETDRMLAEHVTYVHQNSAPPALDFEVFSAEFLRGYIAQARTIQPYIPRDLTEYIVAAYVALRGDPTNSSSYVTARSLLGILRLAQALARLRFSEVVQQSDVEEAIRLMEESKASISVTAKKQQTDPISAVYNIIREFSSHSGRSSVRYDDVLPRILAKGYSQQQLMDCIRIYQDLQVWLWDNTNILFVS